MKIDIEEYALKIIFPDVYNQSMITEHLYSTCDLYEFNPAKNGQNVIKHGIGFQDVVSYSKKFGTLIISCPDKNDERVDGDVYEGLTVDFCKKVKAQFILRGIRYVSDFEYEKTIADANRTLDKTIETIFLTGEPKYTSVASTIVRDIIRNGGNAAPFLPDVVSKSFQQ